MSKRKNFKKHSQTEDFIRESFFCLFKEKFLTSFFLFSSMWKMMKSIQKEHDKIHEEILWWHDVTQQHCVYKKNGNMQFQLKILEIRNVADVFFFFFVVCKKFINWSKFEWKSGWNCQKIYVRWWKLLLCITKN